MGSIGSKIEGTTSIDKSIKIDYLDKTNSTFVLLGQNWVYIVVFLGPLGHFCQSCECYKIDNEQQISSEPKKNNKSYELNYKERAIKHHS